MNPAVLRAALQHVSLPTVVVSIEFYSGNLWQAVDKK